MPNEEVMLSREKKIEIEIQIITYSTNNCTSIETYILIDIYPMTWREENWSSFCLSSLKE